MQRDVGIQGGLKDKVFKSEAVKHAAQFTKMLEAITECMQINFNSDVAEEICNVKKPENKLSEKPITIKIVNEEGKVTEKK